MGLNVAKKVAERVMKNGMNTQTPIQQQGCACGQATQPLPRCRGGSAPGWSASGRNFEALHKPRARAVEVRVAVGDELAHGAEFVPAEQLLEERHLGEGTRDIEAAGCERSGPLSQCGK
jgi:hypothetical protein